MTVGALILTVLGVLAALRIPVQMIPDLEVRTISVRTSWPGATPQDVEKEILIEQEEYLRTIPNLHRLEATASSGAAEIELDFPFGVDITETLIRVNNALNQVPSYPINVDEPRVYASSFSANSFMYFYIAPLPGNPRELDMDMMRDFVEDNVRTRLSNVPGVSEISVRGGAERQVRILLDPARLADRGLTITAVRDAIRRRNQDVSGGQIDSGKRRYLLRTVGRFEDIDQLQDLIVDRRGDATIRLSDVAEIELDHFEIDTLSFINGKPTISLAVSREAGSNVIDIKYAMFDAVARLNRELLEPAGMEMGLTAEDAGYVEASVRNVWFNLGLGAMLATLVMYLFLRSARATAVGIIGIPICTIAAFLGLLAAGRTINVISLAGIAFAIGMTLDNSIVVIESIELARRRGLDRFRSAVEGVRNVWPGSCIPTSQSRFPRRSSRRCWWRSP
jgi:multidrug efflux pump subunit AcrB